MLLTATGFLKSLARLHIREIGEICESRTQLIFGLTDCTDYTDFHVADCNRSLHQELRKGLFISHWRSRRMIGLAIRMTSLK